jgi:hypothetical protein
MGQASVKLHDDDFKDGAGETTSTTVSFDKGLMSDIRDFAEIKASVKNGRDKLNAELAAALAALVDKGFNKDGLKAAVKYYETPEENRENFDLSNAFAREALGLPIQGDLLFESSVERQTQAHTKASKTN